jgi:hypothetical protein
MATFHPISLPHFILSPSGAYTMSNNRSCVPKVSAFSRRRRESRPGVETLEIRQLLATVNWISATSGSWDVASNWSSDRVPGAGDDVTIDKPGVTVTISSNVESVTASRRTIPWSSPAAD